MGLYRGWAGQLGSMGCTGDGRASWDQWDVQEMGRPAGIKGVFKETVRLTEINGRTRRWSDPAGIKETGTTRCLGANMMNGPLDKIPGQ